MSVSVAVRSLRVRFKLWRLKRKGGFEWATIDKFLYRKRQIKQLMKVGYVEKKQVNHGKRVITLYRFKQGAVEKIALFA